MALSDGGTSTIMPVAPTGMMGGGGYGGTPAPASAWR